MPNNHLAVLIPAFKTQFLNDLISCLMYQTVRPSKVFISDDTPDGSFRKILMMKENFGFIKALNIEVVEGPKSGSRENLIFLQRLASAEYFNFYHVFLDDDIIFSNFYEKHIIALGLSPSLCSVSQRSYCTAGKIPFSLGRIPEGVGRSGAKLIHIEPEFIIDSIVKRANNWLGELTHFLFERDFFVDERNLFQSGQLQNSGLEDVSIALNASRLSPIIYLNECLGFFRQSDHNNTNKRDFNFACGIWCWVVLAIDCWRSGRLSVEDLVNIYNFASDVFRRHFAGVALSEPSQALLNFFPTPSAELMFMKDFGDVWSSFVERGTL